MRESNIFELAYEGKLEALKEHLKENVSNSKLAAQVDETKRSLLHWACSGGKIDVVSYLFHEFCVPCDEPDDSGWTPLMIASSCGHFEIAKELIKKGANPSVVNMTGQSPLHYAASRNHIEIVQLLITSRTDCNIQDKITYASPLHRAASKGNKSVVQALLEAKVQLSLQDIEGNTPLHMACEEEREDVIHMLIKAGAQKDSLNKAKKTPYEMAPSRIQEKLMQ